MPQLDTASFPSLLLWLLVGFGLLYLGLRYVILPKLSSVQERRFSQIESILDKAESFRGLAMELETRIEEKNKDLHGEVTSLLLERSQKLDRLLQDSKKEFVSVYENKRQKIELKADGLYEKLHDSLKRELPELVRLALEEIYGDKTSVPSKRKKAK